MAKSLSSRAEPRALSVRRTRKESFRTSRLLRAFLYLLTSLLLLSVPLLGKELRIERFNAEIAVLPDASVSVNEAITVHFIGGPWHGLYPEIPVESTTPQGMNYSLFLSVTRIPDGAGHQLKYESSRERHYRKLKIYIP